jgi:hypothetical protein
MQDEINEKVIALSIRTTKLTAEMLQKSIRFMLSQIKKQLDKPVQHHGKQTLIMVCERKQRFTLVIENVAIIFNN